MGPTIPGIYFRHPSSFDHDTGSHPENAGRLLAVEAALDERDWLGLEVREAPAATREQLLRVHTEAHVDSIAELSASGGGHIDADTIVSPGSGEAALRTAGAATAAVDALFADEARFAFCGTRPPGHHAERARAMGFCLFNGIAVGIAHAIAAHGAGPVLVIDWDVHHGNGTEAIFYDSAEVLYTSIHQSPLYPGTGAASDRGEGEGAGYTLNLPVDPGSGGEVFRSRLEDVIVPRARELRPGLIAVSAGFDAHRRDPLADCRLDEADFAAMAATVGALSTELGAPVLICLEGGYQPEALAASVVATIEAFGEAGSASAEP